MRKLEFVIFLQVLLGFSVIYDAESQLVTITSQPASPLRVLERQPLTLEWTFSVVRTFLRVEVTVSGSRFAFVEASLGAIVIRGVFLGRVSASSTQTNATITIFSLNRTDTANYVFTVFDTDGDFADAPLQLIVQYPPSLITRASDQVMLEGGPAISLTCTADGEPAPNITWTKVYANGTDSHVLSTGEQFMLPNNRTNDGTYLCKASSGIGCDVNHTINVVANFKPEKFLFTVESSDRAICKGDTINITCSAVGKPLVHTYQLFENFRLVHTSKSSVLLWSQETTNTGQTVYTCVANNTVATANSTKAIDINDHPSIEPLMNLTVKPGDNITLTCVVSGKPSPSVSWTQISTGIQHHDEAWEITNIYVDGLGEYRCNASNSCGQDNDKLTLAYMGGKCEEQCKERKTCRYFGKYLCLCERGRKGALCTKTENLALTVQAGFKLKTEEFRPEYEDLKNHRTERLISKIEEAIFEEFTGSGLTNARIVGLRKGSVIVDVELTFDAKVGVSEVSALLDEATEDRRLGEFQVSEVLVGSFIAESPTELSGTVDKDLIYALVIGVLAVMLASSVAYLIIKRKRPVREVERLEEIDTIEESPLNLNMENGRDSEGRISAVNHAYSMELNEITNSHRTYSESEINEYAPVDPTTQSWEVSRENVEIQKVIGNGSFGRVAQGIAWNLPSKKGTTTVAIKMLKENAQEVERRDLFSELEVMKKLKPHPHVIKLLGCVTTADPVLVVIEYVPYGDLLGYLRKSRGLNDNYFNDPDIKPQRSPCSLRLMLMAWQIADGMSYLSSRKIIHRDLAARNVLVGEEEKCKVTDFGMARNVQLGRIPEKWAAYEALTRGLYTTKSDVWSFGVVLYEISTIGGQPYPQTNARDLVELLASGCRMPRPNHVSEALYEIMQSCWKKEPDDRPSFENLRRELKLKANEHTRLISMKDYDTKLYENAEDMTT